VRAAAAAALLCALLAACSGTAPRRPAADGVAASPDAALAASAEAEAKVPERARQSYRRALAAMQAQDWGEAELDLEQLLLEYMEYPGPYVNLAIVYMHEDRNDDAMQALDAALKLDPKNAAAHDQMGILLRREGRFDEAEQAYQRAIEADPDYLIAYYNLGVLLDLYLRREAEALELYQHYQDSLAEPDEQVGRWIIDLRRRIGAGDKAAQVAQEDRP
jgi:tetratricopeptide (TPR) repeat protein